MSNSFYNETSGFAGGLGFYEVYCSAGSKSSLLCLHSGQV